MLRRYMYTSLETRPINRPGLEATCIQTILGKWPAALERKEAASPLISEAPDLPYIILSC